MMIDMRRRLKSLLFCVTIGLQTINAQSFDVDGALNYCHKHKSQLPEAPSSSLSLPFQSSDSRCSTESEPLFYPF